MREGAARRHLAIAVAIVASCAVARLAIAGDRLLSPDEAYYLCAARDPSAPWPIADHPPAVGALIALADRLVAGSIELRVRAVAVLCQIATALGVGALAAASGRDAPDRARRAAFGVAFATVGLMPWVSGLVATPDAPLLAASTWLFVFAARPARASWLAGFLLAAVAVASKVVGLAVVACVAFELARPPAMAGRRAERRVLEALAIALGGIAALPLARASLVLQVQHAIGAGPLVSAPRVGAPLAIAALVSGAVLLFGPSVLVLGLRGRAQLRAIPGAAPLLAITSAALVLSALASGRPPEPNWIAPALLPVFAVAGAVAADLSKRGVAIALAVHVAPAALGVGLWLAKGPPRDARDPLARVPRIELGERGLRQAGVAALPPYAASAWRCAYGKTLGVSGGSVFTHQAFSPGLRDP